jgi:hypothetical protein
MPPVDPGDADVWVAMTALPLEDPTPRIMGHVHLAHAPSGGGELALGDELPQFLEVVMRFHLPFSYPLAAKMAETCILLQ